MPRRRLILPGLPKSGSARSISDKWFHVESKGMGWSGRSQVTRGTINAPTSNFLWESRVGDILKLVAKVSGDLCVKPATPVILVLCRLRGRHRIRAKRSEMNDADEAESKMARASIGEPSGASNRTRQVMRRVSGLMLIVAWEGTELVGGSDERSSLCSSVWWGFWQTLQRWLDLHCFIKCPGLRQLRQHSFSLRTDVFLSCDKTWRSYRGDDCRSYSRHSSWRQNWCD